MKKIPRLQEPNKPENIKWEYDVVYDRYSIYTSSFDGNIESLKKKVNLKCKDGWIPEGSFSIVEHHGDKYICQTIIRPIVVTDDEQTKMPIGSKMEARSAYDNITLSNEF